MWSTEALVAGIDFLQLVDLRSHVSRVEAPTMVVHGANDLVCPVSAGRWLADHIEGAVWVELDGVGHVPFGSDGMRAGQQWEDFILDDASQT